MNAHLMFLTALFVLSVSPCLQAQEAKLVTQPKSDRLDPDERLFLVYAIEDLYRETAIAEKDMVFASSFRIRAFRTQQLYLVDKLRLHIEKKKLDAEFRTMFDEYRKLIDRIDGLAKSIEAREDEYMEFLVKLRAKFVKEDTYRTLKSRAESMRTAAEAGIRVGGGLFATPFDMLMGGLFAGMTTQAAADLELAVERDKALQKLKEEADAYEMKNRPILLNDIAGINRTFFEEFNRLRDSSIREAKGSVAELAKRNTWTREASDFDPDRRSADRKKESRPLDPFRTKQVIAESITRDSPPDAALLEANARAALAAVELIPAGTEKTTSEIYRHYRAQFCALAGRQANLSAALKIGTAGFSGAKQAPVDVAKVGVAAWERYLKYDVTQDDRGVVLHSRAVALAYAGKSSESYTAMYRASFKQSGSPEFWYDAARICSINNNPKLGIVCLEKAVFLGFKNLNEVRNSPDLVPLRKDFAARFEKVAGK